MAGPALPLLGSLTGPAPGQSASFSYPPPAQGEVLTGTICVGNADPGAQWSVKINGNTVATGQGSNSLGPIQAWPSQTVVVLGTNLVQKKVYNITWMAAVESQATANPVVPAPVSTIAVGVTPVIVLAPQISGLSVPNSAGGGYSTPALTVPSPIGTVVVSAGVSTVGSAVAVSVENITGFQISGPQSAYASRSSISPLTQDGALYFPVSADAGDQIVVSVWALVTNPTIVQLTVYGLGAALQPYPLRNDGRNIPHGHYVAGAGLAAGNTTLLGSLGAGSAYMLRSLALSTQTANSFVQAQGVINGNIELLLTVWNNNQDHIVWEQGLMMDPNTSVVAVVQAGGSAQYSIATDVTG